MSKSDKTPTIRFKDFSGEWKPKILGDVLKYEQPQPYIVTRAVYDDRYQTANGWPEFHFGIHE